MLEGITLYPPEISSGTVLLLIAVSFFTSALTAAVGIGGGVALLAVLASIAPPMVVLPVHGVVQIGSNISRASLMRVAIRWDIVRPFALGSLVGIAAGAMVFVAMPSTLLQFILAIFILYTVWAPKLKYADIPIRGFALVGAVATFFTMFIGATGPLLAVFITPAKLRRHAVVATHAMCMSIQHALKALAFGFLGFNFGPWVLLLSAMLGAGFLGTLMGRRVLNKLPEPLFARSFQIVLTLLALRLLWSALSNWQ
jgi:uncharacterized protein